MAICKTNKKTLAFCVCIMCGISNIMAQKEYYLGARDCAIVTFHILNEQSCASITKMNIFDSTQYTHNLFLCNIDSVMIIHSVGGYVDASWFKKVHFILIDDTIQLNADSSYMGSVGVEFDMEYVVLNAVIEKDVLVLNMRDGHPRPAGFICDCEITDKKTMSICEDYRNMIMEKIEHCKLYWNQTKRDNKATISTIKPKGQTARKPCRFNPLFSRQRKR